MRKGYKRALARVGANVSSALAHSSTKTFLKSLAMLGAGYLIARGVTRYADKKGYLADIAKPDKRNYARAGVALVGALLAKKKMPLLAAGLGVGALGEAFGPKVDTVADEQVAQLPESTTTPT